MKYLIWLFSIFFLLVIQIGALMPLQITAVNLILVFLVVAIVISDFDTSLAIALIGGVMLDLISGSADGIISMTMFSIFLIMYFILHTLLHKEPSMLILFSSVAITTIIYFFVFLGLNSIFLVFHLNHVMDYKYFFGDKLISNLFFNLLFTYPVYKYYSVVQSWVTHLKSKI